MKKYATYFLVRRCLFMMSSGMKLVREREASPAFKEVTELCNKIYRAKKPLITLGNLLVIEWGLTFANASWRATYSTYSLDENLGLKPELNGHPVGKRYPYLVNHVPGAFMFQARCEDFKDVVDEVFADGQSLVSTAMGAGVPELDAFKRTRNNVRLIGVDKDKRAEKFARSKVAKHLNLTKGFDYHVCDASNYEVVVKNACVSSIGYAMNYLNAGQAFKFLMHYFRNPNVVRFVADGIFNNTAANELMEKLFGVPTVNGLENKIGKCLQAYTPSDMEVVMSKAAAAAGRSCNFSIRGDGYKYGFVADIKLY